MSNLTKLDFGSLDISEKNYLTWALDAQIHLSAEGHGDTIKKGNKSSDQQKAKAMIFLRRHLHEDLKNEYLTVTDPRVLLKNLKDRYDHQKTVILPKARYEWMHLRLQDFKSVSDYNFAMFRITSKLLLCGKKVTDEDMLEKTFSTFHASNVLLQQQYREKGKNRGRGRGRYYAHGLGFDRGRNGNHKNTYFHPKWKNVEKNEKEGQSSKTNENICYRCGGKGHWSRTCRTPKHLVDLYKKSLKNKKERIETHFANEDDDPDYSNIDVTHLDIGDFFADPDEKIDHLIGDGSVKKQNLWKFSF
ncbi:uncharacterized protein LOC131651482 [Vicia villosa]|uniref:uncharacterized protein LOC131651482 n=1 Tax=Vicia villosa TaxID=3911 RepID=UPI00273BF46E|nr:uncharacterized protein LOC131651482 [Vicia villosa]